MPSNRSATRQSNLRPGDFPELDWSETKAFESLRTLFRDADKKSQDAIDWYLGEKKFKARASRALRLGVIASTTLGAMVPLVSSADIPVARGVAAWMGITSTNIGYVILAIGASMLGLDRFFGFSSAWMRYMTSALRLQSAQSAFRYDWAILESQLQGAPPKPEQTAAMLQRIRDFAAGIHAEIESETKEWIEEFRSRLSEIDKTIREQQEKLKPGSLDITLTNAAMVPLDAPTEVYLDGTRVGTLSGGSWQMAHVPAGAHRVGVAVKIDGRWIDRTALAEVQPGAVARVSITLPLEAR